MPTPVWFDLVPMNSNELLPFHKRNTNLSSEVDQQNSQGRLPAPNPAPAPLPHNQIEPVPPLFQIQLQTH
jgi:hypothetical protein